MGIIFLISRLAIMMYRVFKYEKMSDCVQNQYFIITGAGIHIVTQILSFKWQFITYLLAPIIILTFMNLRFCLNENTQENQIAVLFDTIVFDIFLSILMSMQWLMTNLASIALKASLYQIITT